MYSFTMEELTQSVLAKKLFSVDVTVPLDFLSRKETQTLEGVGGDLSTDKLPKIKRKSNTWRHSSEEKR